MSAIFNCEKLGSNWHILDQAKFDVVLTMVTVIAYLLLRHIQ